jgi:multidrug efflux pump subunit AcrA (membrane-fusion protein)
LKSAQADLASAQSALQTAQANEQRPKALLQKGVITQAQYDDANNQLQTAQAQSDSAQARLKSANDTLSYTKLQSDASGRVTATGAEVGEVVGVGQMVIRIAKGGDRDAVFNVPAKLLRTAPKNPDITLTLADDYTVVAKGTVIPGSALMETNGKPAVWLVSPTDGAVTLQPIVVERHDADTMIVSSGLKDGDVVVTAGVQTLVPGQKVRLLDAGTGAGS